MFRIFIFLIIPALSYCQAGPYAPAAGQPGSTAIFMKDPNFVAWADAVAEMIVGEDADPAYSADLALGTAVGGSYDVACLGRGGQITLSFSAGIGDKPGFDFAVFENSVNDSFLELGWVEVSSDGVNFFRFYNRSLTPAPVSAFGSVDPTDIYGLAGKYRNSYGTPFDLAELRGVSPLLDVDNVSYIRIVDVVGDGFDLDSTGSPIYDPYPTSGTAGFDLDAIGVLNTRTADINEDGHVDGIDLSIFAKAWLSSEHDENFDIRCDIAYPADGFIDYKDFALLSKQWLYEIQTE